MAGMAGSAYAEKGFKRGAWLDHGRIMPGSVSKVKEHDGGGKGGGGKS